MMDSILVCSDIKLTNGLYTAVEWDRKIRLHLSSGSPVPAGKQLRMHAMLCWKRLPCGQTPIAEMADELTYQCSSIQQYSIRHAHNLGISSEEEFGPCRACLRTTTQAAARRERLPPQWAWAAQAQPAQRRPPRRRARRAAAQAPSQA